MLEPSRRSDPTEVWHWAAYYVHEDQATRLGDGHCMTKDQAKRMAEQMCRAHKDKWDVILNNPPEEWEPDL